MSWFTVRKRKTVVGQIMDVYVLFGINFVFPLVLFYLFFTGQSRLFYLFAFALPLPMIVAILAKHNLGMNFGLKEEA